MKKITAKLVRKEFPSPISAYAPEAHEPGTYCVLGGLLQCAAKHCPGIKLPQHRGFPANDEAAEVLRQLREDWTEVQAHGLCSDISKLNDDYCFSEAWNMLDQVLSTATKKGKKS